ncbi:MAG: RNA pseudouridine synthase [Alphaproteobacteria bacterium]|nr:MAG: RNA pseudouridine synthase [Alphaproteobacteria bacterium]
MKQEFHIPIDDTIAADAKAANILAEKSALSKQAIKQAMKKGAVWIEDTKGIRRLRRADTIPTRNSTLHFYYAPHVLDEIPPAPTLIADEGDYSVWSKPPVMLSQGSKWGDHCTINRWIESNEPFEIQPQRNCFIVHRLDRAARGLMLIAHKKNVAAKLSALFEQRNISKCYRIIVKGEFPQGTQIMDSDIDGKAAYSSASLLTYNAEKNRSLLEISIKTGRKHQIRIHMSRANFPVVGDSLHGIASVDVPNPEELQLSAFSLGFICPITQKTREYRLPEHLQITF